MSAEPSNEARRRGPAFAAFLSFIWPGLGQLYLGRRRWAAAFGISTAVLIGYIGLRLLGGAELAAATLLDPAFSGFVLVSIVGLGLWRMASMFYAYRDRLGSLRADARSRAVLGLLLALVLLSHGLAGYYTNAFYQAGSKIFAAGPDPTALPSPGPEGSAGPTFSDSGDPFLLTPGPTPAGASARITFLLTGVDSGHDRDHALTDTLIVATFDPVSGKAVMISVPRDISNFPLYNGLTFGSKINGLMSWARLNPSRFPDGPTGTLTRELSFLLGLRIDYYAAINLSGFEKMVNLVGGVDIDNPQSIDDPRYDWFDGTSGFTLSAGMHHLNGRLALAYVRSRQGVGDSDFTRAARQQQLLLAMRIKLADPSMLTRLPDLLNVAADTIKTNFPAGAVRDYLIMAKGIDDASIERFVLGPPFTTHPSTSSTDGIYRLDLNLALVRDLSIRLFGKDSLYLTGPAGSVPSIAP